LEELEKLMKTVSLLVFYLLLGLKSAYSLPESPGFIGRVGTQPPAEADENIYSKNPEANALYIQAQDMLSKADAREGGSMENVHKAMKLFREAVQKDPQFALAYIGQSRALELASFSVSGAVAPVKIYRQQEAFALKAVQLDDSLPEAHLLLAEIYYDNEYDWPKAEKELKRVIEISPNLIVAHTRYGLFLGMMGRFEEAEAQVKVAQAINGKSAVPNRALMRILFWQHKDDGAIAQGMEALSKDKDDLATHFFLGLVYIHQGHFDRAIEEMKLAANGLGDAGSLAGLAFAYAAAGDKTDLGKTIEQFNQHPAHDVIPYRLAAVYVATGDKDRAISLLEKSYKQRSNWINWLKVDPAMDPIRQDPRFKALMRKMNFEP
jgi:tetratricopeptide (TPR) repeat protein